MSDLLPKPDFQPSGVFNLNAGEREHLRLMWQEPVSHRILQQCFEQWATCLLYQLPDKAYDEPFRATQAQLASTQALWRALERTAAGETHRVPEPQRRPDI